MKVRVQATPTEDTMFPAYGAQIVHMPFGNVYTSLQTGVVDAAENGVNVYLVNKHYEVAPIMSMTAARGEQQPAVDQRQAVVEPDRRAEGLGRRPRPTRSARSSPARRSTSRRSRRSSSRAWASRSWTTSTSRASSRWRSPTSRRWPRISARTRRRSSRPSARSNSHDKGRASVWQMSARWCCSASDSLSGSSSTGWSRC